MSTIFDPSNPSVYVLYTLVFWANVFFLIRCVKQYEKAKEYIKYTGGIISDPVLKKDLNVPKKLLLRYALIYFLMLFLLGLGYIGSRALPSLYSFLFGMCFFFPLNQLCGGIRLYFSLKDLKEGTKGSIEYTQAYSLDMGAISQYIFAFMYFILFLLTGNTILLGGIIISLLLGKRNTIAANKLNK